MELGFHKDSDNGVHWIVAYDQATLVKVGSVTFHQLPSGYCYLGDVIVDPEFRRRGVATKLILETLGYAKIPYDHLRWGIHKEDDDGIALMRSLDKRLGGSR